MSTGNVVEIIGAVIDVEFPRDSIPKIYDALKLDETGLTMEVQAQLGDGVVRAIAMGPSEGLRRNVKCVFRIFRTSDSGSFRLPKTRAPLELSTHAGSSPFSSLSLQNVHFSTTPIVLGGYSVFFSLICGLGSIQLKLLEP